MKTAKNFSHRRSPRCLLIVTVVLLLAVVLITACTNPQPENPSNFPVKLLPTFTNTATPLALAPPPSIGTEQPLSDPGEIPDLFVTAPATETPTPTVEVAAVATVETIATIALPNRTKESNSENSADTTEPIEAVTEMYIVIAGDTLSGIAAQFNTTVEALKATNRLTDDTIYPGWSLIIATDQPGDLPDVKITTPSAPLPPIMADPNARQQLSVLEGDVDAAYPLLLETERFTLHYAPNTIPAQHPEQLADILLRSLAHHEALTGITLSFRFDAYAAGTPFQPPDQSLRGHSYSASRFFVFLDDGSGNLDDLTYLIAHELVHMFAWNVYGQPFDPMLSEGIAVYLGMHFIAEAKHLPISTFCAAYSQVGLLPWVSKSLSYRGHIRDLENYYAGGCFVKYLVESYGIEKFGRLYHSDDFTADYLAVYSKDRVQLDEEWHNALAAEQITVPFDANQLVQLVEKLETAYAELFNSYAGTAEQVARYRELDRVRMALLEGRLAEANAYFVQ